MRFPDFAKSPVSRLGLLYLALSIGLPTLTFGLVQQSLRQSANDPQIQLAEDGAAALARGDAPETVAAGLKVDLRASLAPFVTVYGADFLPKASSGQLDGEVPAPPDGSFRVAKEATDHQNRITWEPSTGVREAAVIVAYKDGYVLAGRSLREVEVRESKAETASAAMLIALLVIGLVLLTRVPKLKH